MTIAIIILWIIGIIAVFFLCREIVLWYWKVNEQIEVLIQINDGIKEVIKEIKKTNKDQPANSIATDNNDDDDSFPDEYLMAKYGISFDKKQEKYIFKSYSYEKLKDAIEYAKTDLERTQNMI